MGSMIIAGAPDTRLIITLLKNLWKKIKEKDTHLYYFPTFDDLTKKVK